MAITVKINTVDESSKIIWESLEVQQNLTSLVDTARFSTRKYGSRTLTPAYDDDIEILDGSTKIFGGKIIKVEEKVESGGGGVFYEAECVDHTYQFDKLLVSRTYKNETVKDIIDDIVSSFTTGGFTTNNVAGAGITLDKVVFNQITPSLAMKKLADLLKYDWYIDADKDINFFEKFTNSAPYNLTDTSGNFVYNSLKRTLDGSQVANRVKVRGGEYDGATYTDSITVSGNASKSFKLPYKMSNLTIEVNSVSKTVGIDFIDDFTSKDVLHNFQNQSFRFNAALSDGDVIEFSGNPKIRVFAIAEDPDSIDEFGVVEKLVRDNSIKDNTFARKRAIGELLAYAQEIVEARFSTYDSGLRTGMLINIQSTRRASDDDLLIKTVRFTTIDPKTFIYDVDLISTKRLGLIEVLQGLLEPEALDIDEVETSEQIFANTETVNVDDEIELTNPVEADESVSIAESNLLDPVAPANVRFVLSPYAPTSQTDTKRPGRLDISFTTY